MRRLGAGVATCPGVLSSRAPQRPGAGWPGTPRPKPQNLIMATARPRYRSRNVKGMRDLLPPETAVWQHVESVAREVFADYGFEEIRTPVVEETELFVRGVGQGTDIVGKQMFTFDDKKGKSLSLRPENTAAVARAIAVNGLASRGLPLRLFYVGPQFRYERPQKGRYRQFHQIGAELVGDAGPWSDVETIAMLVELFGRLGFERLEALVNTVGDAESRVVYGEKLRAFLEPHRDRLSEDSRRRLVENPLRILDSKNPAEIELLRGAPRLEDSLSAESREHFAAVRRGLDACGVGYRVADRLVRGLDYYTRTVFEIVSSDLGAQSAVVGGGRYDGLVGEIGGADLPAFGFAIGFDRLIEILPESFRGSASSDAPVWVVAAGDTPPLEALLVARQVRGTGRRACAELGSRSMKAALKAADRAGARLVVLIGDEELAEGTVTVRDFRSGSQQRIARTDLGAALAAVPAEEER